MLEEEDWVNKRKSRREIGAIDDFVKQIIEGDRIALSRAITLIESTKESDQRIARALIQKITPYAGNSFRIAVTGVPGVGKSSFIEAIGNHFIQGGQKIAVLSIDPSSEESRGSILGDKTRMPSLSASDSAFIRPTATNCNLGGVAKNTRETILLCEAAGYSTIFIETVGVGQSETIVHKMVDVFLLLVLVGAGDELQGIKRGIMELADFILLTKVEEQNQLEAKKVKIAYTNALHYFQQKESGWTPTVLQTSVFDQESVLEVFNSLMSYLSCMKESGFFSRNRQIQNVICMREAIHNLVWESIDKINITDKNTKEELVMKGVLSPYKAAEEIVNYIWKALKDGND